MRKSVAALVGLLAFGLMGLESAVAQGIYFYGPGFYAPRYHSPGLSPWQVARIVRSAGLRPLGTPARRGPSYVVVAANSDGNHVRVVVDAYRGAITSVGPVANVRRYGEPLPDDSRAAVTPPPPVYGEEAPPLARPGSSAPGASTARPPQQPNQRLATAPAVTGSTAPAEVQRTPLPRPRPNRDATAAVTPAPAQAPVPSPPATATAPAEVPEAPPAPVRPRPPGVAASEGATAGPRAAAPPAPAAAVTAPAPRPATQMVPVAPLD